LLSVVLPVILLVVVALVMLIFQSDLFYTHFLIPSPGPYLDFLVASLLALLPAYLQTLSLEQEPS
jgi:hypothetical protein